ncbi:MAG: PASTA domain-containing protein, partial [Gemmatimonadaceae bacterium]
VISFPYKPKSVRAPEAELRLIPNVSGLDLRDAVRTLHAAGFQVKLEEGTVGRTKPAAGTYAHSGTSITLGTAR